MIHCYFVKISDIFNKCTRAVCSTFYYLRLMLFIFKPRQQSGSQLVDQNFEENRLSKMKLQIKNFGLLLSIPVEECFVFRQSCFIQCSKYVFRKTSYLKCDWQFYYVCHRTMNFKSHVEDPMNLYNFFFHFKHTRPHAVSTNKLQLRIHNPHYYL